MSYTRRNTLKMLAGIAALGVLPSCHAAPADNGRNAAAAATHDAAAAAPAAGRPLKIGIIGAGWLGGTVGRIWVKAGHEVMFSARNLDKVRRDIQGLGARARVGTPKEAAAFGDVLLFAVPYTAMDQLGKDLAPEIRGKIVLDATNTNGSDPRVQQEAGGNVAVMSSILLPDTRLVRAFSCVDATQIEASFERGGRNPLAVPIAGDDAQALATAEQLVRDTHCVPVSVGGLANAVKFQRGSAAFRNHTNEAEMRRILGV